MQASENYPEFFDQSAKSLLNQNLLEILGESFANSLLQKHKRVITEEWNANIIHQGPLIFIEIEKYLSSTSKIEVQNP